MTKRHRHEQILALLETQPRIGIAELARQLDTSEVTVRRDVHELAAIGSLERAHGYVLRGVSRSAERPFHWREGVAGDAKEAIARAAAGLVRDGDAVSLDVGSTVLRMLPHLAERTDLTIVTSSLRVAWQLSTHAPSTRPFRLIVAGGPVRSEELSMSGAETCSQLRTMRVDVAFLGVAGVTADSGFSDFNLEDAEVKRVLVKTARRRVVLADHTKLGQQRFAHVADVTGVDLLVTDEAADRSLLRQLTRAGLEVLVAPSGPAVRS